MKTLRRVFVGLFSLLTTATAVAQTAVPVPEQTGVAPEVGNAWTYRYSDGFGKSALYKVQVTAVSAEEITDELRSGRTRAAATFFPGLEVTDRKVGNLSLREISPYLQSLGPSVPASEWRNVALLNSSAGPFDAHIVGTEIVQVPAGSFEATKLVIKGIQPIYAPQFSGIVMRRHTITVWYAPAAKRFVKATFDASAGGAMSHEIETIELTETNFAMNMAATAQARPQRSAEARTGTAIAQPVLTGSAFGKAGMPKGGDNWTYRYSDGFGKSALYKVQVTAVSAEEITDELRSGRTRAAATFFPGLEVTDRKVGNLSLREISPYLQSLGPSVPASEWRNVALLNSSAGPFDAHIVGTEIVQVPAGSFEATKLVIKGIQPIYAPQFSGIVMRRHTITVWYAPAAKRFVKATFDASAGGAMSHEIETIELTEYRLN